MSHRFFKAFYDLPAQVAGDFITRAYLVFASSFAVLELLKHAYLVFPHPLLPWAGVLGLVFVIIHLLIASPLFILYVLSHNKPKLLLSIPLLMLGLYFANVFQLNITGGQDIPAWVDVGISALIDVYVLALTAHVFSFTKSPTH